MQNSVRPVATSLGEVTCLRQPVANRISKVLRLFNIREMTTILYDYHLCIRNTFLQDSGLRNRNDKVVISNYDQSRCLNVAER